MTDRGSQQDKSKSSAAKDKSGTLTPRQYKGQFTNPPQQRPPEASTDILTPRPRPQCGPQSSPAPPATRNQAQPPIDDRRKQHNNIVVPKRKKIQATRGLRRHCLLGRGLGGSLGRVHVGLVDQDLNHLGHSGVRMHVELDVLQQGRCWQGGHLSWVAGGREWQESKVRRQSRERGLGNRMVAASLPRHLSTKYYSR